LTGNIVYRSCVSVSSVSVDVDDSGGDGDGEDSISRINTDVGSRGVAK
jgi:hypothetical protein